ncbi:MAG TPA: hypothetical protein DCO75_02130 [Fibrobacteres bacterium]|jgi:hypothetical protein|nr:hypothetical protein [Fibrobacterota bacterium]
MILGLSKTKDDRENEAIVKKHDVSLDKQVILASKLSDGGSSMAQGPTQSVDTNGWGRNV